MFPLNTFSFLQHTLLVIGWNKLKRDSLSSWLIAFIIALNFLLSFKPFNINKMFCLFWMKFILLPNLSNLFINFTSFAISSTLTTISPTTSKIYLFTATPNVLHEHFCGFLGNLHTVPSHMDVPQQYVGIDTLLKQNRLFINYDLCGFDNDSHSVKPQTFQYICDYLNIIDILPLPNSTLFALIAIFTSPYYQKLRYYSSQTFQTHSCFSHFRTQAKTF